MNRTRLNTNAGIVALLLSFSFVIPVRAVSSCPADTLVSRDSFPVGTLFRPAAAFPGAVTRVTGERLRQLGTRDLLRALSLVDPALALEDHHLNGSDPNYLPLALSRGAGDAWEEGQLPLFLLDGFEVSLARVVDLDLDRVAAVTLFKDAAGKATHGTGAANGLIAIETLAPGGSPRVRYAGEARLAWPDLNGYAVKSARETLQAEVAAGRYGPGENAIESLQAQRARVEQLVNSGVNTRWLDIPTRVAVGHAHSLRVAGGGKAWRHAVDLAYDRVPGTMKGSGREHLAGALALGWRGGPVDVAYAFEILSTTARHSPHGFLREYAALAPYWQPRDEQGNVQRVLGEYQAPGLPPVIYYNPAYNAAIPTRLVDRHAARAHRFTARVALAPPLALVARVAHDGENGRSGKFYPAGHTRFAVVDDSSYPVNDTLGVRRHVIMKGKNSLLAADLSLEYTVARGAHALVAALLVAGRRYSVHDDRGATIDGDINYPDGLSGTSRVTLDVESTSRALAATCHYAWGGRLALDVAFRGESKPRDRSWSAGVAWHLREEPFARELEWLDRLTLRGSTGRFDRGERPPLPWYATLSSTSRSFLDADVTWRYLQRLPLFLEGGGASEWNAGLDLGLAGRFSARVDIYRHARDHELPAVSVPVSIVPGGLYYPGTGRLSVNGHEISARWTILDRPARATCLALSAAIASNKSKLVLLESKPSSPDTEWGAGERPPAPANTRWRVGLDARRGPLSLHVVAARGPARKGPSLLSTIGTGTRGTGTARVVRSKPAWTLPAVTLDYAVTRAGATRCRPASVNLSLHLANLLRDRADGEHLVLAYPYARGCSLRARVLF
jgi:hypothetical protein